MTKWKREGGPVRGGNPAGANRWLQPQKLQRKFGSWSGGAEIVHLKIHRMADVGIPYVIMGRGAWQKAADPEALETFMLKMGTFTLLTWALIISAAFVLFGLSLSFYLLFDHLSGYNKPEVGIDFLSIKLTVYFIIFKICCKDSWRKSSFRILNVRFVARCVQVLSDIATFRFLVSGCVILFKTCE